MAVQNRGRLRKAGMAAGDDVGVERRTLGRRRRSKVSSVLRAYPHPHFWILHIDGSAMPNPGRMAIGVVLTGPDGSVHQLAQVLPGSGCNNEAELRALQAGLALAQAQGASGVRIYTDSHWLLEQLAAQALGWPQARATVRLAHYIGAAQAGVAGCRSAVALDSAPPQHRSRRLGAPSLPDAYGGDGGFRAYVGHSLACYLAHYRLKKKSCQLSTTLP